MDNSYGSRIGMWEWWASLVFVLVLTLTGCDHTPTEAPATDVASDSQSHPRIAALLPFAADQLLALGVTPVAVPEIRGDVPQSWDNIPTVTLDHSAGPNLEQLIAVAPDVIVTSSVYAQFLPMVEDAVKAEVVVVDVDSIDDVIESIKFLGSLAGREQAAEQRVTEIETLLPSVATDKSKAVNVLAVFGTPHAFYAFLPDSYLGDLVAHAGGVMITSDLQSHSVFRGLAPFSMEAILDRDPDHLLVVFHGPEESARAMLEGDALWSQLSAVKRGSVTFLHDDLYAMRPGSELPRAVREITEIVAEARVQLP